MSESKKCPACGEDLKRIFSKKKQKHYWTCMNGTDKCGAFYNDRDGTPVLTHVTHGEPQDDVPCPNCQSPMKLISGSSGGNFFSCSRYPDCRETVDVDGHGHLPPLCPEDDDHGPMKQKKGANGLFFGCRRYPECRATLELDGKPGKKPHNQEASK
ncbi:MAG: topoisomerase DNA-binding C4 zinc finger domain-containing protein [Thermoplasmataceae archaeon]